MGKSTCTYGTQAPSAPGSQDEAAALERLEQLVDALRQRSSHRVEAEIALISGVRSLSAGVDASAWVSPSVFPRGPLLVPRKPKKSHVFPRLVVQHHWPGCHAAGVCSRAHHHAAAAVLELTKAIREAPSDNQIDWIKAKTELSSLLNKTTLLVIRNAIPGKGTEERQREAQGWT